MNQKIYKLAKQADQLWDGASPEDPEWCEKFAELIVRECAALCDQAAEENARTFYTVNQTQEVGPALVAKGSQVQAEKLSRQIRQHFGVE